MTVHETDVLVIGGGGAGMRAALAARNRGCRVLLASKTPLGQSTCTYFSGGIFTVAGKEMSKETHLARTLQSGRDLNSRKLAEILVEEAPACVQELEGWGLVGSREPGYFFSLGKSPAWGAPVADLLAKECGRQGVAARPWVAIGELIVENGRLVGALGFDFREGKTIAFQAGATILANGGGGALYQRNDNPARITGDGYALAYHAGCRLRDMEFVQFLPQALGEPGKPAFVISPALCDAGKIVNADGEDILEKYRLTERPVVSRSRDAFSLAIVQEGVAGRDVLLDLRALGEADWPRENIAQSQRELLVKHFRCREKPLRIFPVCHHLMGGIAIDEDGRTEIRGLFAAGEVAGGVHGANRLGGNALGEILVFGRRAGAAAAQWAKDQAGEKDLENQITPRLADFQKRIQRTGRGLSARELRKSIGRTLWEKGGILRDGPSLRLALEDLLQWRKEKLPEVSAENPKEVLETMEAESALWVGEMIIRSALRREESRGAHFRKDFPRMDDQRWRGNIFLKKSAAGMDLEFHRLPG